MADAAIAMKATMNAVTSDWMIMAPSNDVATVRRAGAEGVHRIGAPPAPDFEGAF